MHRRKGKHVIRNIVLTLILVLIVGGAPMECLVTVVLKVQLIVHSTHLV